VELPFLLGQQERTDEFDVYEVVTEVKIKKVEPPYA
jgi:hypothetical protein